MCLKCNCFLKIMWHTCADDDSSCALLLMCISLLFFTNT